MRCKSLLLACSLLALTSGSTQAAEWRLVEVSGTVRIAVPGAEGAPARLNQAVPTGSSITTTLGARAALDNGLQHIVVGPNSRMTVAPDAGGFTRVMQDLGAVMFKVDKQRAPHFRVDTPLLAAIVKGTTFTVVVGPQSDAVNVAEGLVEVRSNATDMASDVPAGSSGAVSRDAPQAVQVTGTVTPAGGEPSAMKIEPLDYKTVSGGLVESGGPGMPAGEALAIASGNGSASASPGAELVGPAAPAIEVARNDRQPEASIAAGASGGDGPPIGGTTLTPPPAPDSAGSGNDNSGAGNGNGGAATETGGSNGNGGASTETGNAGTNTNGNGNGNGNGGVATGAGNAGTSGNGNGNGNGGASTETGNAGTNGNGNGNRNGGASTETGSAGNAGNNGNGNNGNGDGGSGGGLVDGLLNTVGAVTEDGVANGKGHGRK